MNGPNTESIAFGGAGWVIEPEEESVWGLTSQSERFLTVEIDLEHWVEPDLLCWVSYLNPTFYKNKAFNAK